MALKIGRNHESRFQLQPQEREHKEPVKINYA